MVPENVDDADADATTSDKPDEAVEAPKGLGSGRGQGQVQVQPRSQIQGQEVERISHHSYEEIAASEANSEVSPSVIDTYH